LLLEPKYAKTSHSIVTNKAIFKGNKAKLTSKICVVCGRTMTWRKSWAKNWDEVKYCSDKCRAHTKTNNSNHAQNGDKESINKYSI